MTSSLKKKTFAGFLWTFLDVFVIRGSVFIAMIVLARLLGPEDFGLVGMIAVFIAIGKSLTDSGMSHSLIRTTRPGQKDFSTVFYINLVMSLIVYALIYILAPFIADFFGYQVLINLVRTYCVIFIIIAFSAVQLAILTRNMKFRAIALYNIPSNLIGVLIGISLGYLGYGVWSIIWMYLAIEIVRTILLWGFSDWKPKLIFSWRKFREHYGFGYKLMLSGLLNTLFQNIYNVLIGKFYSAQSLGYYERSKQFTTYPSSTLTGVISKVTYPMLSSITNDKERLEKTYRNLLKSSFFIIAPIMLATAAVAEPLFTLVLGEEWLPAVIYFQILSLAMMLHPVHSFNLNILKVFGRSDLFLKIEVIKKIITVLAVLVAFQFGVIGLVWSSVFTSFSSLYVNMHYSSNLINYPVKQQIIDLAITLLITLGIAVLINLLVQAMEDFHTIYQIIIPIGVGTLCYLSINYLYKSSPIHTIINLIKNRK